MSLDKLLHYAVPHTENRQALLSQSNGGAFDRCLIFRYIGSGNTSNRRTRNSEVVWFIYV